MIGSMQQQVKTRGQKQIHLHTASCRLVGGVFSFAPKTRCQQRTVVFVHRRWLLGQINLFVRSPVGRSRSVSKSPLQLGRFAEVCSAAKRFSRSCRALLEADSCFSQFEKLLLTKEDGWIWWVWMWGFEGEGQFARNATQQIRTVGQDINGGWENFAQCIAAEISYQTVEGCWWWEYDTSVAILLLWKRVMDRRFHCKQESGKQIYAIEIEWIR